MVVSWIMSILAVVILSVVADLLLSGKRMGKFVKGVFASLTIIIIVSPLPNILSGSKSFDNILFTKDIAVDQSYIGYANSLKVSALEKAVQDELSKKGYKGAAVKIDGNFDSEIKIEFVTVNLSNLVMDEKVVHINKYDALTRIVSEYLGVDKGVVIIYE